jgi:hypothetical protein
MGGNIVYGMLDDFPLLILFIATSALVLLSINSR